MGEYQKSPSRGTESQPSQPPACPPETSRARQTWRPFPRISKTSNKNCKLHLRLLPPTSSYLSCNSQPSPSQLCQRTSYRSQVFAQPAATVRRQHRPWKSSRHWFSLLEGRALLSIWILWGLMLKTIYRPG